MSRIIGVEKTLPKKTNERIALIKNGFNKNDGTSKDEQEKQQIRELLRKLPKLNRIFDLHRKIGEGTFSSVYLGTLKNHSKVTSSEKQCFAIKHLVPTSHPARIEHELRCLQDIGGKENVIGVDLCLRHLDTIVFVMPYIPHKKFSDYVADMDANEVRQYMKALLTALRHVHSFGVIHRDVKPSNFLYDRENRRYLLVDFGLAQRVVSEREERAPPPAHSSSIAKRRRDLDDDKCPDAKRLALDLSTKTTSVMESGDSDKPPDLNTNVTEPLKETSSNVTGRSTTVRTAAGGRSFELRGARGSNAIRRGVEGRMCALSIACACAGAGGVCSLCAQRPQARAPRAGTQGFRPPEVLLKVRAQGVGVDVWASGVVLVSALTARYPLLRAADDAAALAELVDLLGSAPLRRAAAALGRRLVTSTTRRGLCLRKLAAWLRSPPTVDSCAPVCVECGIPAPHCICKDEQPPAEFSPAVTVAGFPDSAFALAARLLDPDPRTRITAANALSHPFFTEEESSVPPVHASAELS